MAETPARVVSVNLCTDQLALLLADPGQVVAVSPLAFDPDNGMTPPPGVVMTNGQAEQVHALAPDLVLGDVFSRPALVSMLTRLGHRVELFTPATSLDDIRANLHRMGDLLGQQARAKAVVAEFDAGLAALQDDGRRPRAALWFANGYAPGPASLAGQILDAAGYDNVAVAAGITGTGFLSLEQLALLAPEVIVTGAAGRGGSRAEDITRHPILSRLQDARLAPMADHDWVCGTPDVLRAVARLADLRRGMTP